MTADTEPGAQPGEVAWDGAGGGQRLSRLQRGDDVTEPGGSLLSIDVGPGPKSDRRDWSSRCSCERACEYAAKSGRRAHQCRSEYV
jgi:hypothetical protein